MGGGSDEFHFESSESIRDWVPGLGRRRGSATRETGSSRNWIRPAPESKPRIFLPWKRSDQPSGDPGSPRIQVTKRPAAKDGRDCNRSPEERFPGLFQQRIATSTPFLERLVAFWSNHLCVSAQAKPQVLSLAGHYEREVIRPHVLGRFSDMVLASARHPAMLFYLDNARSIGPSSRGSQMAARRGRKRGLNRKLRPGTAGTPHVGSGRRIHPERCRTAGPGLHRLDRGRAWTAHGHEYGRLRTTGFHVPPGSP